MAAYARFVSLSILDRICAANIHHAGKRAFAEIAQQGKEAEPVHFSPVKFDAVRPAEARVEPRGVIVKRKIPDAVVLFGRGSGIFFVLGLIQPGI